jgi:hypothetical protein
MMRMLIDTIKGQLHTAIKTVTTTGATLYLGLCVSSLVADRAGPSRWHFCMRCSRRYRAKFGVCRKPFRALSFKLFSASGAAISAKHLRWTESEEAACRICLNERYRYWESKYASKPVLVSIQESEKTTKTQR